MQKPHVECIGDTAASEEIGTSDSSKIVNHGNKFIDAGVERNMIESEGITENVKTWRTDGRHPTDPEESCL